MHAHFSICLIIIVTVASIIATNVPIIGILSQETYSVQKYLPSEDYESFIAASYVKFVESAGARVIPVWIGQDETYYRNVIKNTNGILFPGGATWFNESGGIGDAGQILYDIALEVNKNGEYYPIFGICLGMELLAQVAIGGTEIRAHCSASNLPLPLDFSPGFNASKLFNRAPDELIKILRSQNVTYNVHQYCLTRENFTLHGLDDDWRILATNEDKHGLEFISVFESKDFPFYGIQFHPEKNLFEFITGKNIPHSLNSALISQYFANFFIEETRKNEHSFNDWQREQNALIYNYNASFVGLQNSSYEQIYAFKQTDYKSL